MDFLKRHRYPLLLLLIMVLHVALRIRFLNHQLIIDEGNNLLCLQSLAGRYPGLQFGQILRYHPPLYLVLANTLSVITGQRTAAFYETFSIALSSLTLIPLYLLGREVFTRRAGLLASLAYAVTPAAMAMDSWIKVDQLEVLFAVCFVYFLVREKAGWAGLSLGLALLSKETVVFVVAGIFVYLIIARDRRLARVFFRAFLLGALLSFWWYLFVSQTRGRFLSFLLGTHAEVSMFDYGVFYYFKGALTDLGPLLVIMVLGGSIYSLYAFFRAKRRFALLPLACALTPYLMFLVLKGKPPWMITTVIPFIALLAGAGMNAFLDLMRRQGRPIAVFATSMLVIAGLGAALPMSYDRYMLSRQGVTYSFSREVRREAQVIDEQLLPGETLLIYFGAYVFPNSVFLAYLSPRPVVVVEESITPEELSETLFEKGIKRAAIFNDGAGNSIALYMMLNDSFGFAYHAAIPFYYLDATEYVQPVKILPLTYYLLGIRLVGR
jgi:4-amino-4-deoxy-L-arabinose transferase-like glycosyltransferase